MDEVEAAATESYWTAERMAAATPMDPGEVDLAQMAAASAEQGPSGPPGFSRGGLPDPAAAAVAAAGADEVSSAAVMAPDEVNGTSNIYTTYLGNWFGALWKHYPYHAAGKLYFRHWNGSNRYCTASVISRHNKIVMAAHCLYDTDANRWHGRWLFVPAERNGVEPYLRFAYSGGRILTAFINSPSFGAAIRYDMGVLSLFNNSDGRPVTFYTGWLGTFWNYGYIQNITQIGYPSNLPSGTLYTYITHAETFFWSTDVIAFGTNTGGGTSGGPIMIRFAPYQSGLLNQVASVNSARFPSTGTVERNYGPRFLDTTFVALCNAEGCGL
jgi:V8-like Glu-specific endopeptidase